MTQLDSILNISAIPWILQIYQFMSLYKNSNAMVYYHINYFSETTVAVDWFREYIDNV